MPLVQSQTILPPLLIRTHIVILGIGARLTSQATVVFVQREQMLQIKDSKKTEEGKLNAPKPDTETPKD